MPPLVKQALTYREEYLLRGYIHSVGLFWLIVGLVIGALLGLAWAVLL